MVTAKETCAVIVALHEKCFANKGIISWALTSLCYANSKTFCEHFIFGAAMNKKMYLNILQKQCFQQSKSSLEKNDVFSPEWWRTTSQGKIDNQAAQWTKHLHFSIGRKVSRSQFIIPFKTCYFSKWWWTNKNPEIGINYKHLQSASIQD